MSKVKIPTSVVSSFSREQSKEGKELIVRRYKDWQESEFSKAHYAYLCKEYDRLLNEYVNASWATKFLRTTFLIENKAKLQVIKKLKDTFKCETI